MKMFEYMGKELFAKFNLPVPVPKGRMVKSPEEASRVATKIGRPVMIESQILSGKRGKAGGIKFADNPELSKNMLTLNLVCKILLPVMSFGKMGISLNTPHAKELIKILKTLYTIFTQNDTELVEINPMVLSGDQVIAADAKVTIDDEALNRQPELPYVEERTATEKAAHDLGLSFVELDGNIGVMANGAGITMGPLDTLAYFGQPANFLDAGGGTGEEGTAKALGLILTRNPKSIIINIFGGITRCDDVARAFATVKKNRGSPVPVVIRLVGTNQEAGRAILKEVGIEAYDFMQDAAKKVVELAN